MRRRRCRVAGELDASVQVRAVEVAALDRPIAGVCTAQAMADNLIVSLLDKLAARV